MSQAQLDLDLAEAGINDRERNTPARVSYELHYETLLTIRGYFDRLQLETLVRHDQGTYTYKSDADTVCTQIFSAQKAGELPTIADLTKACERLWATKVSEQTSGRKYEIVFKAEANTYIDDQGWDMPLDLSQFRDNSNYSKWRQTEKIVESDSKTSATRILAEELNIDILWADIIRQKISLHLLKKSNERKQNKSAEPNFLSRDELKMLVDNILERRPQSSLEDCIGSQAIETISFPSLGSKNPFVLGIGVRPEHIASDLIRRDSGAVDDVISNLKTTGASLISGPPGTGKSSLLWTIAKETTAERCWFRVNSFSCLDSVAVRKFLSSYQYNYPIGFVLDGIDPSNYKIFLEMVDLAKDNENIWILGTVQRLYAYLVNFPKFLLQHDLTFDTKRLSATLKNIDAKYQDKDRKSVCTKIESQDEYNSTGLVLDETKTAIIKVLMDRYDVATKGDTRRSRQTSIPQPVSFRTSKKSRKQKPKQINSVPKHTPHSRERVPEMRTRDPRTAQEREDELEVLIATAYIFSLGGSVSIASLCAHLSVNTSRVNSAIQRLHDLQFLFRDDAKGRVYGEHRSVTYLRCKVLVEEGYATWQEIVSISILISDSSFLEVLGCDSYFLEKMNNARITKAIESRFKSWRELTRIDSDSIKRSDEKPTDLDREETELEECTRLARGILHAHLLITSGEWSSNYPINKVPPRYAVPTLFETITGETKRLYDDDRYDVEDIYFQAKSWYRKVSTFTLPSYIVAKIVSIIEERIGEIDVRLIIEALSVLVGIRVDSLSIKKLRKLTDKIVVAFRTMNIHHVMEILEIADNLSTELSKSWIQAYEDMEACPSLGSRLIEETPHALPLSPNDDGAGPYAQADIHHDIVSDPTIDLSDLVLRQTSALRLLYPDAPDIICCIADDEGKQINDYPHSISFERSSIHSRVKQRFAFDSAITLARYFGPSGWSTYLDSGLKILEKMHRNCTNLLNDFCAKAGTDESFEGLSDIIDESRNLRAPLDADWFDQGEDLEFEPMQRVLAYYDYDLFEFFESLPMDRDDLFSRLQKMRNFCWQCIDEPWEHITHKIPAVLEDINKVLSDLQVVALAAENSAVHPIERWPVPEANTEHSFQYIVSESRNDLNGAQRKKLHEVDFYLPRPL